MTKASTDQWIIFDADNTLWDVEVFYNKARHELSDFVAALCTRPKDQVDEFQRKRDRELSEVYGYSSSRFARSFEDTIYAFVQAATPDQVRHVRALAESVFVQKAILSPDVELVLRSLRSEGWSLGLLTAGERWVQERRIADFHLQGIFHAIEVVESKTIKELSRFCQKHEVKADRCWVVGDSLRSDIASAVGAGMNAILVPHDNWSAFESDAQVDPLSYTRVNCLKDVLKVVGVSEVDFRPAIRTGIDCYGVFEGGGAKGLAHVGALQACEERNVRFRGVAGTSAGAIIAGLIAVGYKSKDLFSTASEDNTLIFDREYISLFGRIEWDRAHQAIQRATGFLSGIQLIESQREPSFWANPFLDCGLSLWRSCRNAIYWLRFGAALRPFAFVENDLGYFSLTGFQSWYNKQLARKLNKSDLHVVTFADIGFDLQIISADLRSSKLIVHSKATCPNRSVAEAVAASVCIPLVFKPKVFEVDGEVQLHVDGGMISNFPAWVFSEMSSFQHRLPVLGFELIDASSALPSNTSLPAFLRALLATTISGKKGIEIRGIQNMHFIPIPVSASTLQFDTTHEMRRQTFCEGYEAVSRFFPSCFQLVPPEQMAPFLFEAHQRLLESVGRPVHLRINVMDMNSLGRLSIRYKYNMDFDPDDQMELPITAGGAGQCFTSRQTVIVDLYRARREYPSFEMSKYEQALVRPTLRSLLSVPIFDAESEGASSGAAVGVLNIDSDDLSVEELGQLEDLSLEISAMISHVWVELAKTGSVGNEL